MNYPIKIVGVVVDIHNLTMYKEDGDTIVIPQGDARLKDLVAKLVPAIEAQGWFLLMADDMQDRNHFAEAEQKSNGFVRFFRMTKKAVQELVEKFVEPIAVIEVGTKGNIPMGHSVGGEVVEPVVPEAPKPVLPKPEERPLTKSQAAVAEIMAQAVPSTNPRFNAPDKAGEEETTVVAVLDDNTVIPGVEVLSLQAQSLGEQGKGTGMENFLRRAAMIKRGHSVEDLLKFIEKGELPLADDGCVLVYKLLNSTSEKGVFKDCHSGNVKQRVGSYVHMDEKLVDANRRRDCSNGLHVARRDYLNSFHGDICVLAKLAPEDVIAVPEYDARKLRAKGYHIIAELSATDRELVRKNKPMQDQVLLGNAIAGNHIGIIERVEITASKGGGLRVTPVAEAVAPELDQSLSGSSLDHLPSEENPEAAVVDARALALDLATGKDKTVQTVVEDGRVTGVNPVLAAPYGNGNDQLIQAPPGGMVTRTALVEPAVPATPPPAPGGLDEDQPRHQPAPAKLSAGGQLAADFTAHPTLAIAKALVEFKKSKKKGWAALGIDQAVADKALALIADSAKAVATPGFAKASVEAVAATLPKGKPQNDDKRLREMTKPAAPAKQNTKAKAPAKAPTPKAPAVKPVKEAKMTQQEEMAKLVALYEKNPDKPNARAIYAFKQKSKKSWDVLGVTDAKFIKKITERAKL